MDQNYFLLKDKIADIESKFTSNNGWLKIYSSESLDYRDAGGVFCYLISNDILLQEKETYNWSLSKGSEGKPSVYGDNTYKTYDKEGIEPFVFYKHFNIADDRKDVLYLDISEEFILYFRLYEEGPNKQHRIYYYVDDFGKLDEVIIIEQKLVKIKVKYLREYITMRDMHFVVCFDYMRLVNKIPTDWNVTFKDELTKLPYATYNHLIRNNFGYFQSWLMGKVLIEPSGEKKSHFDAEQHYADFIVGFNNEGEIAYQNCSSNEDIDFKLTYFDKKVLDKYYNDPSEYEVDGFSVKSRFFYLKIDNNKSKYVPVFLRNLRILPHDEQLHWKQYNIPPKDGMGISKSYYNTMILGKWAEENETVDLFFKSRYKSFSTGWRNRFGWDLYKPLSEKDEYLFAALHSIKSNNIKAFCEQTLTIVKLTIDRLNEKELMKDITPDKKVRGIGKFELFLENQGCNIPDMFDFLRHLQNLRSGLIAHSFSDSNKDCKKAFKYFEIGQKNYADILDDIFIKSINTMNTLENYFHLSDTDKVKSHN